MSPITNLFSSPKAKEVMASPSPKVNAEPAPVNTDSLKRVGRASLIATSAQGVLGNAKTGRKQLLSDI